ncbi:DUF7344 domain-containing protein [Halobacterium yunchengense]|uniref:DUF7344 domain-containing protein n=1 Tax=Halobacterium yunchengense TaxID=3108497 RepID=UPI003008AA6C
METTNPELSVDDVFKAVSNVQRRKLLDSLISDSPPDEGVGPGIVVDVDAAMYHRHLPKLADCGLINWDRDENRVTRGPNFEAAAELLDFVANESDALSLDEAAV